MTRFDRPGRTLLVLAVCVGLSGCASMSRTFAWLMPDKAPTIRPIKLQQADATPATSPTDRAYRQASIEIQERRYGNALELLRYAQEGAPGDVRILNALGVVYDKLGRFDLSGRYYAQALAAEPNSSVVLANMAYSHRLQDRYDELQRAPMQLAARTPAAPAKAPAPAPVALAAPVAKPAGARITLAASIVAVRTAPILVGRSLSISAGSASLAAAGQVRDQLAARGWSVARAISPAQAPSVSLITYPAHNQAAAIALARTLPFQAELAPCKQACDGLRIVLGENARWKS